MAKSVPGNFLIQADAMLRAWRELNPEMKMGTLSQADLDNAIKGSRNTREEIENFKTQIKDRRQTLDKLDTETWNVVKRSRSGSKSQFGDDSKEYAMFGGKRTSDRKKPTRRTPKAPSA